MKYEYKKEHLINTFQEPFDLIEKLNEFGRND